MWARRLRRREPRLRLRLRRGPRHSCELCNYPNRFDKTAPLLVLHQRKHVTPAPATVAEENLSLGMYKERRIPLVMQWAQTHPLATAPANVGEPGDEIHQVHARLHSCRVGVTRRKRIRSEFHDAPTLDL